MKSKQTIFFVGLIFLIFSVHLLALALRAGIGATPYETRDRAGRTLGFNDPISPEHYRIIFSNVTLVGMVRVDGGLSVVCALLYGVGAWLLLSPARSSRRGTRLFFISQSVLFSWGWFALLTVPYYARRAMRGTLDREDIIDVPFVWMWAGLAWVSASTIIATWHPGEPLGLRAGCGRLLERFVRIGNARLS